MRLCQEAAMKVNEILRVKGSRLVSMAPDGLVEQAIALMAEQNLGSLVVMDNERMVGILTFHELLKCIAAGAESAHRSRVSEVMERNPVTATPDMEVNDLRRTMLDSGARYLPVVLEGRLLGVISFRDVAKAVLEEQDFENRMLKGYIKNWPA